MALKSKVDEFWKEIPSKNYFYLALIINLITVFSVLIFKNSLPPLVPIFYGRPVGASQLVSTYGILIAPGSSFIFFVINTILARITKDLFLKKSLMFASFFISVLTGITVLKVIFLVGFFN